MNENDLRLISPLRTPKRLKPPKGSYIGKKRKSPIYDKNELKHTGLTIRENNFYLEPPHIYKSLKRSENDSPKKSHSKLFTLAMLNSSNKCTLH